MSILHVLAACSFHTSILQAHVSCNVADPYRKSADVDANVDPGKNLNADVDVNLCPYLWRAK
jgi:hypothetical protein